MRGRTIVQSNTNSQPKMKSKHKVLILYRFLPHYRLEFYELLKTELEKENIEFSLVYGKANKKDALKNDEIQISWATRIRNYYLSFGKIELLWQPCLRYLKGQDLIIVEQANKLLVNYLLMIARRFGRFKLGIWGHGRNMQISKKSIRNRFKNLFLHQCDGYFAYTPGVKDYLKTNGYPEDKIQVVYNSIDTKKIRQRYLEMSDAEISTLRNELGVHSENVGIFCGGIYSEKRIDFLISACEKVREQIADFHMIIIGSGIEADKVKEASKKYEWIHYVGPKLGTDRVPYFKLASIHLMPGLVGLAILDSFALETPLITTEYEFHSPEIEYLRNGYNGEITSNDLGVYVDTVVHAMEKERNRVLVDGCVASTEHLSIENMVKNFKNGILKMI